DFHVTGVQTCALPISQLEFPVVYTNARTGTATRDLARPGENLKPLFELILAHLPGPAVTPGAALQFQCNNLDYDDYVGRLAIGRVKNGSLRAGGNYVLCNGDAPAKPVKITQVYNWSGLNRAPVERVDAGDIAAIAGIEEIDIGDTIADAENPRPLPGIRVDEPTIAMFFSANTSPWAGRDGDYVTSRKLRERLLQERRRNVSIRVEE